MGRILSKEEFMESMITSAEEAEESKNMDLEVPEEKPRKKAGTQAGEQKKGASGERCKYIPKRRRARGSGTKEKKKQKGCRNGRSSQRSHSKVQQADGSSKSSYTDHDRLHRRSDS